MRGLLFGLGMARKLCLNWAEFSKVFFKLCVHLGGMNRREKMKLLTVTAALATLMLTAPTAFAQEDPTTAALDTLQIHMGSTFACESVLGAEYVDDARATGQALLERLGMTATDASAVVAQAETKLRRQAAEAAETVAAQPVPAATKFCLAEFERTKAGLDTAITVALRTL